MTGFKLKGLCALLMLAFAVALTACGDDDSDKKSSTSESTAGSIAVPAEFEGKTLKIATDAAYAPSEFVDTDGKTIVGFDVDLGKAIGEKLGLDVEFQNATFDGILAGVESGKFDMSMSSFTDTKEREEQVDFVTYFSAGTSFFVNSDGGPDVQSLDDLCGLKVAVQKGTTQQEDAEAQQKKCDEEIDLQTYPDQNGANQALASGRAEVSFADSPVAAYQVKLSKGDFKLVGEAYGAAPYGIALPKGSPLAAPIQKALEALIADGTYEEILKEWGVESGAIANPEINGAIS